MKNNFDKFLLQWLYDSKNLKWEWVCMCMNEKYGTGRLLLKAQVGTKGLQRQLEIIS